MADKAVSELVPAEVITATDLFVLEQNGTAKKLPGQVLLNWLTAAADGHGGISKIEKLKTSGLADTYRITLADTTTFDFVVNNGKSISNIAKTSTSGLVDTYTITYNDGAKTTFTVTNGAKGDKGDNTYVWVKYASQEPTASSSSFGDLPDDWIGIYYGGSNTAPTDWQQYKWFKIKGEKGDTGAPATLISASVSYQVSDSGTIIPSGKWITTIPVAAQGKYLWTRMVHTFNTGEPVTAYTISRMGLDGLGSVVSVANISPDLNGNVLLTPEDIGALSVKGGNMEGSINMQGQAMTGLNEPTENSDAANKGYVDTRNPYNYIHNADFSQFVAQAGIGGSHGTDAYAGDRWILDSGTVTGEANEDGGGYTNITLNGTIRQIVANAPAVATPGIEMISGTATITYADGEVTITSSGGVLGFAKLFAGEYTKDNMPKAQPRGYIAELQECKHYLVSLFGPSSFEYYYIGQALSKTQAFVPVKLDVPMRGERIIPTIVSTGTFSLTTASGSSETVQAIAVEKIGPSALFLDIKCDSGLVAGNATIFLARETTSQVLLSLDL